MIEVSYRATLELRSKGGRMDGLGRAECANTLTNPALAATSTYGKEPLLP